VELHDLTFPVLAGVAALRRRPVKVGEPYCENEPTLCESWSDPGSLPDLQGGVEDFTRKACKVFPQTQDQWASSLHGAALSIGTFSAAIESAPGLMFASMLEEGSQILHPDPAGATIDASVDAINKYGDFVPEILLPFIKIGLNQGVAR
jgi:hypothetical protein